MTDGSGGALVVDGVTRHFGSEGAASAVDDVTFEVAEGEMYTILGPSGCGKTTTLRMIAGLETPDGGLVAIGGEVVSSKDAGVFVPPNKRDLGMVFQSYGIWPHLTVFENAAFPLRVARPRLSKRELSERVEDALARVRLLPYAGRVATELSGGQQQRLALARALVRRPKLLLLDEPLSNLDANLREAMRDELVALQRQLGITTLYVTHDQDEALSMSDRVAVMAAGRLVQEGRPRDLYHRPATAFVARFLGVTNVFEGAVRGVANGRAHVDAAIGPVVAPRTSGSAAGEPVQVAIRPERARLCHDEPRGADNVVKGQVERLTFRGDHVDCQVRVSGELFVVRDDPARPAAPGDHVWIELPADSIMIIPADAGS
jgi:iron(III) transport system ATP-binding protein